MIRMAEKEQEQDGKTGVAATMRDHYRASPKNDKISASARNPEIAGPSTHSSEFCVGEMK